MQTAYSALVGLVAVQRLVELRLARRNTRRLLAQGGIEHGRGHYPWMVVLHTAFLGSCLAEVWLLRRPFVPALGIAAIGVLAVATGLRYWAIRTLGERWTTRVIVLPAVELARHGPYRYLRHPNYLAVVLEIAALPLVHTAWMTALLFSAANALLLRRRIAVEEAALRGGAAAMAPEGASVEGGAA